LYIKIRKSIAMRMKIKEVKSGGIITKEKKDDLFKYAKVIALMKRFKKDYKL
tara:strand:- start:180 stop:335 length:156 start_codon:yes stop_codon:yes gene_type:complete